MAGQATKKDANRSSKEPRINTKLRLFRYFEHKPYYSTGKFGSYCRLVISSLDYNFSPCQLTPLPLKPSKPLNIFDQICPRHVFEPNKYAQQVQNTTYMHYGR